MNMARKMSATVSGNGPRTVVLANGFCTSASDWDAVVSRLEADFRIVRFEYVGYPGTPDAAWNPDRYAELYGHADDVLLLLRELEITGAAFVGHSLSAMIGALVQVTAPTRINHLVTIGGSPRYIDDDAYVGGFSEADVDALIESADCNLELWIAGFAPGALGTDATPEQLRSYQAHFLDMRPDVARQLITSIFHSDFRHVLPRVTCRVDVVQTQHDVAVPRSVAEYLVQHMPDASLHILPVSGHVPFLTHSEVTSNTLHGLLAQHTPTP